MRRMLQLAGVAALSMVMMQLAGCGAAVKKITEPDPDPTMVWDPSDSPQHDVLRDIQMEVGQLLENRNPKVRVPRVKLWKKGIETKVNYSLDGCPEWLALEGNGVGATLRGGLDEVGKTPPGCKLVAKYDGEPGLKQEATIGVTVSEPTPKVLEWTSTDLEQNPQKLTPGDEDFNLLLPTVEHDGSAVSGVAYKQGEGSSTLPGYLQITEGETPTPRIWGSVPHDPDTGAWLVKLEATAPEGYTTPRALQIALSVQGRAGLPLRWVGETDDSWWSDKRPPEERLREFTADGNAASAELPKVEGGSSGTAEYEFECAGGKPEGLNVEEDSVYITGTPVAAYQDFCSWKATKGGESIGFQFRLVVHPNQGEHGWLESRFLAQQNYSAGQEVLDIRLPEIETQEGTEVPTNKVKWRADPGLPNDLEITVEEGNFVIGGTLLDGEAIPRTRFCMTAQRNVGTGGAEDWKGVNGQFCFWMVVSTTGIPAWTLGTQGMGGSVWSARTAGTAEDPGTLQYSETGWTEPTKIDLPPAHIPPGWAGTEGPKYFLLPPLAIAAGPTAMDTDGVIEFYPGTFDPTTGQLPQPELHFQPKATRTAYRGSVGALVYGVRPNRGESDNVPAFAVCLTLSYPEPETGTQNVEGSGDPPTTVAVVTETHRLQYNVNETAVATVEGQFLCTPTPYGEDDRIGPAAQTQGQNVNALNKRLLPEHARAVSSAVLGVVEDRVRQHRAGGPSGVVASTNAEHRKGYAGGFDFSGNAWSFVAGGDYGHEASALRVGALASVTRSEFDYEKRGQTGKSYGYNWGDHNAEIFAATPYASLHLPDTASTLWAAATIGRGVLEMQDHGRQSAFNWELANRTVKPDLTLAGVSAGAVQGLWSPEWTAEGSFESMRLKVDKVPQRGEDDDHWCQVKGEPDILCKGAGGIRGLSTQTRDAQAQLRYTPEIIGGDLVLSGTAGVRHRGGDGATGNEWTAGVEVSAPNAAQNRLALSGRMEVAKGMGNASDTERGNVSLDLTWNNTPGSAAGFTAQASTQVEGLAGEEDAQHGLDAKVGYGVHTRWLRGVLVPYSRVGLRSGASEPFHALGVESTWKHRSMRVEAREESIHGQLRVGF